MKTKRQDKKIERVLATAGSLFALTFSLIGCPSLTIQTDGLSADANVSVGDYGDAPDQRDQMDLAGAARFPTKASSNGAHHLDTTLSALGYLLSDGSLPVSAELDATDPNDPDLEPNLGDPLIGPAFLEADQDHFDDGFFVGLLPPGGLYDLPVVVTVAAGAEDKPRYINILADWSQDLEWNGTEDGSNVPEWVVQNFEINVKPGTTERVFTPTARIGGQMYDVWFRVTLSETPVVAGPEGWDGTGEFQEGETEDYIYRVLPRNEIDPPPLPPPPFDPNDPPPPPENPDGDDDAGGNGGPDPVDPDDPDNDGQPGVDPNNIGKLRRRVANVYSLVLCKGATWRRGFEWETQVRNPSTSNPFTATTGLTNDPGQVIIHAVDVGTSRVSFEANEISFPVESVEWATGIIDVTVINCDPSEEAIGGGNGGVAPDPNGPWDGIDNVDPEDAGKLVHARGNEYYLVLCLCDHNEVYRRGFEYETFVYNGNSSNPGVATVGLSNDPGTITITPLAVGETTITFDADPSTFPVNDNNLVRGTIHVKVIDCFEYYFGLLLEGLGQ